MEPTRLQVHGRTQYALFWVNINESLLSTPTPIAQSNDATWEYVSPIPPAQLQCAAIKSFATFQGYYPWGFHSSFGSGSPE